MKITKRVDDKIREFKMKKFHYLEKPSKILISQELFDEFVKEWEPFLMDFREAKKLNNTIKQNEDIEYKGIKVEIVPEEDVIIVI